MPDTATHTYHGSYLMPSLEHATVADAMHPGILSCELDATLSEVAQMMATQHVHCVAVVGMTHKTPPYGFVWGIISDLDLSPQGSGTTGGAARDLAGQPVITVKPSVPHAWIVASCSGRRDRSICLAGLVARTTLAHDSSAVRGLHRLAARRR